VSITTVFFDLDDTLYPAASGLWQHIRQRISIYMHERLNIPAGQVEEMRQQLFEEFGTTLRGLQSRYSVDRSEFLAYVHDVPLTDYIAPSPHLRKVIQSLPQRKFIFTNADRPHAERVLRVLELQNCFEGIIDVVAMEPYCKPMPQSFEIALKTAGEPDPQRCALIDDIHRTTRAARQYGVFSILYGSSEANPDADAVLIDWANLPEILTRRK
jgi:putative hydrolase of the HAD superfamily